MPTLKLKTRYKGNQPQFKENLNSIVAFLNHDEDRIEVKQSEQINIDVYDNGQLIYSGTKAEFFNKLKGTLNVVENDYIQQGDFVNDGSYYQLFDYVFEPCNDDEGFTYYQVKDFNDNLLGEIVGITLPDEDDIDEIEYFEFSLTTWLEVQGLI